MKLFIIIQLFAFCAVECFLTNPFLADNSVKSFLNVVESNSDGNNLMNQAIAGELCNRECKTNDKKVCRFKFMIKFYQAMSGACGDCLLGNASDCFRQKCVTADGVPRGILTINFQLPGPSIQVCKGDVVMVDVENEAEGISTSIHFHGMRQIDTQWMDGVPYVTQCPIPYGTKFRYIFHALDEGTHFYHSHSGHQKIDGVFGALIVRQPIKKVPNRKFYDFDLAEHVMLTSDWMHSMAENHFPGMARRSALSESMLINGRGRFFNETENKLSFAPWTIFHVRHGFRYRFRIINSAFNVCPFQLQVESHNFSVIATELSNIKPIVDVDTLHFLSGERFDIVINAHQPAGDYWIRTRELMPCWKKIDGFAILRVHDGDINEKHAAVEFSDRPIPKFDDEYPTSKVFNAIKPNSDGHIKLTETEAYDSDQSLVNDEPDEKFFLVYDSPAIRNDVMYARRNLKNFVFVTSDFAHPVSFVATVNNISFQFPSFPLLTEPQRIDESMFCDVHNIKRQSCIKKVNETICKCIHRLKVKLNASVEIVATNLADKIPHPLHLHGHRFQVVATGTFNDSMAERTLTYEEAKNLNFTGDIVKNPPFKDTALLPFPGFVRFQFRASNPGFWLFHCHYDYHMLIGMALIVQVGEIHEMKEAPKDFPTCHNFLPTNFD